MAEMAVYGNADNLLIGDTTDDTDRYTTGISNDKGNYSHVWRKQSSTPVLNCTHDNNDLKIASIYEYDFLKNIIY